MKWYFAVLKKYAVFDGRAGRSEFWWFSLVSNLVFLSIAVLETRVLGLWSEPNLATTYGIAVLLPTVAVCVRRLQDIGKSGWWFLLICYPAVGALILLAFCMRSSEPGENRHGPNPTDSNDSDTGEEARHL